MPAPPATAATASSRRRSTAAAQPGRTLRDREAGIERDDRPGRAIGELQPGHTRRVHEERGQREQAGSVPGFAEQGQARPEDRPQAHDQPLAQRIDGWVGHLGESLAEEVAHRPGPGRQVGQRRVVTHRERGLLGVVGHGAHHHGQVLLGQPVHHLALHQVVGHLQRRLPGGQAIEAVGGPMPVGGGGCDPFLAGVVVEEAPGRVDEQHLARAEPAPGHLAMAAHVDGADLGAHRHEPVVAHLIAQRAQAVAIEAGTHPHAVGEDHPGRAIPGLHQGRVVAVEAPHFGIEVADVLPRLGHHHGHHVAGVASRPHEQLDDGVELSRVGVLGVEDGEEQVLGAEAGRLRAEAGSAPHAVLVAPQGVDLAVVAQRPVRLGAFPGGQRVGREALVEDRERGPETLVGKVGIEVGQGVGGGQALVDHRAERARRHVRAVGCALDPPAEPQRPALHVGTVGAAPAAEQDLHDVRSGGASQLAERSDVERRLPPVDDVQPLGGGRGVDRRPGVLTPHEQHRNPGVVAEQRPGDGHQEPRPVGGPGVGGDRPAVLDARQPVERGGHDGTRRAASGIGDEADAAGVKLTGRGGEQRRTSCGLGRQRPRMLGPAGGGRLIRSSLKRSGRRCPKPPRRVGSG